MTADYSKVHRLLRLITLMQQNNAGNAALLADKLSVTQRTIYRDLAILADLGVPHYLDEQTHAYRINKDFFLPPVQLTGGETLALFALAQGIGANEQIALTGPAARAIEKIRGQLPQRVLQEIGDLDQHIDIHLPATGPAGEAIHDVFDRVRQAIYSKRALSCQYESLNNQTDCNEFIFKPYALAFDQRAWYAIGHHSQRNEIRRLKLNRFTTITPTENPYMIPDDFSLETYRGKAWRMIQGDQTYQIIIDFDAEFAETVADTNWHSTQEIQNHPDGSITFCCEVDGLDEIVWWVLGYGPHVVVRQPKELANRVAELVKATGKKYLDCL